MLSIRGFGALTRKLWLFVVVCLLAAVLAANPASSQADGNSQAAPQTSTNPSDTAALAARPAQLESPPAPVAAPPIPSGSFEDLPPLPGEAPRPLKNPDPEKTKPVRELPEERESAREVWVNADGSKTMKLFDTDKYFRPVGKQEWQPIDATVVPDASREGWLHSAANSWTVSFGPISGNGTGGVELDTGFGMLQYAPAHPDNKVLPVVQKDKPSVVLYREVWTNVDVRYTVSASGVKEELIVRGPTASSSFEFAQGGTLQPMKTEQGGVVLADPTGKVSRTWGIGDVTVADASGKRVDRDAKASVALRDDRASLVVGVDQSWLAGRPSSAFPIVIDPTWSASPIQWEKVLNGGGICGTSPYTVCPVGAGNFWDLWSADALFRTEMKFGYEALYGKAIVSATLNLPWIAGDTYPSTVNVYEAYTPTSFSNVGGNGVSQGSGTIDPSTPGAIDITGDGTRRTSPGVLGGFKRSWLRLR